MTNEKQTTDMAPTTTVELEKLRRRRNTFIGIAFLACSGALLLIPFLTFPLATVISGVLAAVGIGMIVRR